MNHNQIIFRDEKEHENRSNSVEESFSSRFHAILKAKFSIFFLSLSLSLSLSLLVCV